MCKNLLSLSGLLEMCQGSVKPPWKLLPGALPKTRLSPHGSSPLRHWDREKYDWGEMIPFLSCTPSLLQNSGGLSLLLHFQCPNRTWKGEKEGRGGGRVEEKGRRREEEEEKKKEKDGEEEKKRRRKRRRG